MLPPGGFSLLRVELGLFRLPTRWPYCIGESLSVWIGRALITWPVLQTSWRGGWSAGMLILVRDRGHCPALIASGYLTFLGTQLDTCLHYLIDLPSRLLFKPQDLDQGESWSVDLLSLMGHFTVANVWIWGACGHLLETSFWELKLNMQFLLSIYLYTSFSWPMHLDLFATEF